MAHVLGSRVQRMFNTTFDLACKMQVRRLSTLEGCVMVAAIEIPTGVALHSIRQPVDLDFVELYKTASQFLRSQSAACRTPSDGVRLLYFTTRYHAHVVHPLRREPRVALYVIVETGGGRAGDARLAVSDAAFELDTMPGSA